MLYSAIFDLLQDTQASFDYLAKIVKSGFVYDLKYDLVYPTVSQLFQTTLIPQFIQNIDPQVITDLVAINSNIYKKNTYINTNLLQYMINDILNTTFLFEAYLKTFQFYDVFLKYVSYDFISIIYNVFVKSLAYNIKRIGTTTSFYDIITLLLNIPSSSIISVNTFFRLLYRNDYGYNNSNYTAISNFFNVISLSPSEFLSLVQSEYNLVEKTIKSEYYFPNNEYITQLNVIVNNENLPYDTLYTDITRLQALANRTILINVNDTNLLDNISYADFSLLIDFLNIFLPEYVKVIIIDILLDKNLTDSINIQDDVSVETLNYIPYNIVGYCGTNAVLLSNAKAV